MQGMCIRKKENHLLELGDLRVHLVSPQMRFELGEVVDRSLAVCRGYNVLRVLPNLVRHFVPSGFDCRNGIGQSAVLFEVIRLE
jgi:hypothetical protein